MSHALRNPFFLLVAGNAAAVLAYIGWLFLERALYRRQKRLYGHDHRENAKQKLETSL